MMQVIDENYISETLLLPDGPGRITRWIHQLIDDRDTAQLIAKACVEQIQPLKEIRTQLQAANTRLTLEMRDVRHELQAELDAAHAELDDRRRMNSAAYRIGGTVYPSEADALLDWLKLCMALELTWGNSDESDETSDCCWRVHQRGGNRNDREWNLVGMGATPLDAIRAAKEKLDPGEDVLAWAADHYKQKGKK